MNKWKVAFFVLAGAVILCVAGLFYMATLPVKQVALPDQDELDGNVLVVQTTAKEFESIAKTYLGNALDKSPLPVELEVEDQIYLYSDLTIFNITVPIKMDFEPIVSNGNIRLKQTAVHVGKLNIQPSYVLKLMNESIDFPNWITVLPDDEEIYVDLSRINIASGSRVRAKEIDLANDNILLEIVVPE